MSLRVNNSQRDGKTMGLSIAPQKNTGSCANKKTSQEVRDPFSFSAPPLTAPRRHDTLFLVFQIASPTRSTYAAPALLWQIGFISFFEPCLCAYLFTGCR